MLRLWAGFLPVLSLTGLVLVVAATAFVPGAAAAGEDSAASSGTIVFQTVKWEIWVMSADGSNQQPPVTAEMLDGVTLQYNGMEERMLSWQ